LFDEPLAGNRDQISFVNLRFDQGEALFCPCKGIAAPIVINN